MTMAFMVMLNRINIIGDNPNSPEVEEYAAYSHLAIDNDFVEESDPLATMRATVAHEFQHNVQFTYDFGDAFAGLDEAGATWIETQTFEDEAATPYVGDLLTYPDRCIGSTPEDPLYDNRVYAEWLMIDSMARDFGTQSLHSIVWRKRADFEGMLSFYLALDDLGTNAAEVIERMAIRNLLQDYELSDKFGSRVYIEGAITGTGTYFPRRDGVQQLGVDYLLISELRPYTFKVDGDKLKLFVVGD